MKKSERDYGSTSKVFFILLITLLECFSGRVIASETTNSIQANTAHTHPATTSISSNPAAVNIVAGSGAAQRYLEEKLGIKNNHGIHTGGLWLGDANNLFSGGIHNPKRWTYTSLVLLNLTINTEEMGAWKGGLFGVEFLHLNAQNVNGQAGSIQGYNSLPGPPPLSRSELYQLWYRQEFFSKKLIVRIGKTVPTLDFGNVIKPVPLTEDKISIPAVTGLIYTPIFVNSSMIGVMPGYYNSAYGITLSFAPIQEWYLSYGAYDGNSARNRQTGPKPSPTFNGSYFHIAETGSAWLLGKNQLPGNIGAGLWHQTGLIIGSPTLSEIGSSGFYLFGTQRLWYKNPGRNNRGISSFYQYGLNNSDVLPMKKYLGLGLTGFGLLFNRYDDSIGAGAALAWLNKASFSRTTELMYQAYYQAKIINGIYLEPVISYIPTPGASPLLNPAWAGTLRLIVLF